MGTSPKTLAAHQVERELIREVETISLSFTATCWRTDRISAPVGALRPSPPPRTFHSDANVDHTLLRRPTTTDEAEPLPAQLETSSLGSGRRVVSPGRRPTAHEGGWPVSPLTIEGYVTVPCRLPECDSFLNAYSFSMLYGTPSCTFVCDRRRGGRKRFVHALT